ncbi:MAG TPA: hypothetical protein VN736_22035 [Candidatus Limnocylindrales bacterium]|nr:hypothetical protein [Candidatus Limnocylindrales bacterium]
MPTNVLRAGGETVWAIEPNFAVICSASRAGASPSAAQPATFDDMRAMLRNLLADRFQVQVERPLHLKVTATAAPLDYLPLGAFDAAAAGTEVARQPSKN